MYKELLKAAEKAAENAYSPYSGLCVGAAILSKDGRIFTGCNIENASFGATVCAERVALFSAIAQGVRTFRAIAVTHTPCGICRQTLSEFGDMDIVTTSGTKRLSALLPDAFKLGEGK